MSGGGGGERATPRQAYLEVAAVGREDRIGQVVACAYGRLLELSADGTRLRHRQGSPCLLL